MRAFSVILILIAATAWGETFRVTDEQGHEYGPFEVRSNATITTFRVGDCQFAVERAEPQREAILKKLDRIVLPSIAFRQTPLLDVITFLDQAILENDPEKTGIRLGLTLPEDGMLAGPEPGTPREPIEITFSARDIPALQAIRIITQVCGMKYRVVEGGLWMVPADFADEPLVKRYFPVGPGFKAMLKLVYTNGLPADVTGGVDVSQLFSSSGVSFPRTCRVVYYPSRDLLWAENTEANLARLERGLYELQLTHVQAEVEVQFVRFDATNVALLGPDGVNVESLRRLWTNGHGTLLAAPRAIAESGQETSARGFTEVTYPTDFNVVSTGEPVSNRPGEVRGTLVQPREFETRDAGAQLEVRPEVGASGGRIGLHLTTQYCEEPVWRDFGVHVLAGKTDWRIANMEVPYFHSYAFVLGIEVEDGATVLAGGGIPTRDGLGMVYCFVTARLVDTAGKSVRERLGDRP